METGEGWVLLRGHVGVAGVLPRGWNSSQYFHANPTAAKETATYVSGTGGCPHPWHMEGWFMSTYLLLDCVCVCARMRVHPHVCMHCVYVCVDICVHVADVLHGECMLICVVCMCFPLFIIIKLSHQMN